MAQVNIPIPDELHKRLRLLAISRNKTLKLLFIELLEEAIKHD